MNVVLVHESLTRLGGAERVLMELHYLFPDAPIYALLQDDNLVQSLFPDAHIHPSFLRTFPKWLRKRERMFLPLLPVVPETFDLSRFDVVISSASAFAKGVVTRPGTLHICYCHAPTRYLWDWYPQILDDHRLHGLRRAGLVLLLHYLRMWDQTSARRVDRFIANSETTKRRIRKYYGRDADVIYPPVDVDRFTPTAENKGYFLLVSRLAPYKRADLVVNTFNKLELPLVIVGTGRDADRLRRLAGRTTIFNGHVPDAELPAVYAGARAVIFPSDDDFGIVPVEAMASGKPVIAFRRGGATETIIEGVTGEFFDEPVEAFLAETVRQFLEKEKTYDVQRIRKQAEKFSRDVFRAAITTYVERAWDEWQAQRKHPPITMLEGSLR